MSIYIFIRQVTHQERALTENRVESSDFKAILDLLVPLVVHQHKIFFLLFPLRLMHITFVFFTLIFVPKSLVTCFGLSKVSDC